MEIKNLIYTISMLIIFAAVVAAIALSEKNNMKPDYETWIEQ